MAEEPPVQSLEVKQRPGPPTELISEREIRKQLLIALLQDKGSLVPFSVSALALLYSLLYAPVLGGLPEGLGTSGVAALVGAAVFIWRYVIRFQQNYAAKSQELLALLDAQNLNVEEQRLADTHGMLENGFSEIRAAEGLSTLHKLDHEYEMLGPVLNSGKETDLLSSASLEALVKRTYLRGISVLEDVFELERAVRSTDCAQLQSEISALEKGAAAASADPAQRERLAQINERIASNQERLRMVNQLKERVEELLHQANRCEASLGKTRIELAALKADASEVGVSAIIETLSKTIDRAREVQEELKRMGY